MRGALTTDQSALPHPLSRHTLVTNEWHPVARSALTGESELAGCGMLAQTGLEFHTDNP